MLSSTHQLVGRAGADAQLRTTASGIDVAWFSMCVQDRRRQPDGSWVAGPAVWFRVTAWRSLARNVKASVRKGDNLIVIGSSLEDREWTGEAQAARRTLEVTATFVGQSLQFNAARSLRTDDGIAELLDGPAT